MSQPNFDIPILLIDDDAMVRGVLLEYLQSFGFRNILHTKDPQQALKWIQDPKIEIGLILSDWEMPKMTGMTLLKAVRSHPNRKFTRFIMITSQQSIERFKVLKAKQWTVSGYLVKPFRAEVLRERIWKVLRWVDEKKMG